MSSIVNINKNYETKNKDISRQLSFDVGEKFTGRIVSADTKNNVVQIRLPDGWQFEAQIDKNLAELPENVSKFEVEGFEGGRLKIKLIGKKSNSEASDDALKNFIASEGFSDEDLDIIKKMIGNKMDLFKENILKVKGLLNFKSDINNDSRQEAEFINKFISTRGISTTSEEAQDMKKVLSEFFTQFKTMSDDEVLLFLKCNIDFNSENIKAFKDILGSNNKIYDLLKDMKTKIDSILLEENNNIDMKSNIDFKQIDNNSVNNINLDSINKAENETLNKVNYTKEKDSNVNYTNEVNTSNAQSTEKKENFNIAKSLISQMYSSNKNTQVSVLSLLKAMTGKNNDVLKYVLSNTLENYTMDNGKNIDSKLVETILNKVSEDDILLEFFKNTANGNNNIENISKNELNKSLSNLFGFKIEVSDQQYNNIKNSLKFLNNENYINKDFNSLKKEILMDTVTKDMVIPNNNDKLKNNNTLSDTQKIVKEAIKERTDEIKDIIKDIIKKADFNNDTLNRKVINIIKNSISEFKVFNSISNEYYYMDIPVKMREQEYPCKLIIKDDRKNGKKLDSTNLKFVVTVKTISLGTVDAYVKVKNKNIDVDFRCDKNSVNILSLGKQKLMDKLLDLGYTSNIYVTKKDEEVTIISCDKFFDENGKIHALDRMV